MKKALPLDIDYPLIDPGLIPEGFCQTWDEKKHCYVLAERDKIQEYQIKEKTMDEEKKDVMPEDEAPAAGIPDESEKTEAVVLPEAPDTI